KEYLFSDEETNKIILKNLSILSYSLKRIELIFNLLEHPSGRKKSLSKEKVKEIILSFQEYLKPFLSASPYIEIKRKGEKPKKVSLKEAQELLLQKEEGYEIAKHSTLKWQLHAASLLARLEKREAQVKDYIQALKTSPNTLKKALKEALEKRKQPESNKKENEE
ncbi:MAG: hypothetical protein ACPLZH_01910, partial [Minisyncoccales bacterium]